MDNKQNINYEIIDNTFHQVLEKKPNRKTIKGRIDMENIAICNKVDFIYGIILSFNINPRTTYRILFWEQDENIISFLKQNYPALDFIIYKSYRNGQRPGICILYDIDVHKDFLGILLAAHLNFELGRKESLNMRMQMLFHTANFNVFFDIYDDRGFYLIWEKK